MGYDLSEQLEVDLQGGGRRHTRSSRLLAHELDAAGFQCAWQARQEQDGEGAEAWTKAQQKREPGSADRHVVNSLSASGDVASCWQGWINSCVEQSVAARQTKVVTPIGDGDFRRRSGVTSIINSNRGGGKRREMQLESLDGDCRSWRWKMEAAGWRARLGDVRLRPRRPHTLRCGAQSSVKLLTRPGTTRPMHTSKTLSQCLAKDGYEARDHARVCPCHRPLGFTIATLVSLLRVRAPAL